MTVKKNRNYEFPSQFEDLIDTRDEDIGLKMQIFWSVKNVRDAIAGYGDTHGIGQLKNAVIELDATIEAQKDQKYERSVEMIRNEADDNMKTIEKLVPDPDRRYRLLDSDKARIVRSHNDKVLYEHLVLWFREIQKLLDRKNLGLKSKFRLDM